MISPSALISKFRTAVRENWGYIYGKTHEIWSDQKQKAYIRESADNPDRRNSVLYGAKWAGHWVTDCSGLFKWAFSELGGSIAHGSNSIWEKHCSSRGTLASGKRADGNPLLPGTAVFTFTNGRRGHIGLYVGGNDVIEAAGARAGVTVGSITDRKWTAWGELRSVDYHSSQNPEKKGETLMAKVVLPEGAGGASVNLRRQGSGKAELVCRVPVGAEVDVLEDCAGWCLIRYAGQTGWMMSSFLESPGREGETGGDALTPAEIRTALAALTEIDRQAETLRRVLERRG